MFHCIMASHYSVSLHWLVYLFVTLCSFWFKCKKNVKPLKIKLKKKKKPFMYNVKCRNVQVCILLSSGHLM